MTTLASSTSVSFPRRNDPERLRSILNALDDGIIAYDPQGRLVLVNAAARRLLGLPQETRLLGHTVAAIVSALDGRLQDTAMAARALEPPRGTAALTELPLRNPGARLQVVPLHIEDGDGRVAVRAVVLREHSHSSTREPSVNLALRTVAHDLKTPLTNIKAYTQLAALRLRRASAAPRPDAGVDPVAQAIQCLETVVNQANKLSDMITQALEAGGGKAVDGKP